MNSSLRFEKQFYLPLLKHVHEQKNLFKKSGFIILDDQLFGFIYSNTINFLLGFNNDKDENLCFEQIRRKKPIFPDIPLFPSTFDR